MSQPASQEPVPKPTPVPDERSEPFFAGARDHRLMLQHCRTCSSWSFPVRERCPSCFSPTLEWQPASGRGTLYTFTIFHQSMHPGFAAHVPYNVAQIDLDEGVRMTSNIVGVGNAELRIGMRLEAVFEEAGGGVFIPKFRPVVG